MAKICRNHAAVAAAVAKAWGDINPPVVGVEGSRAKLTHPTGRVVTFDLCRGDLAPDRLADVVALPIAALREALQTKGRG